MKSHDQHRHYKRQPAEKSHLQTLQQVQEEGFLLVFSVVVAFLACVIGHVQASVVAGGQKANALKNGAVAATFLSDVETFLQEIGDARVRAGGFEGEFEVSEGFD